MCVYGVQQRDYQKVTLKVVKLKLNQKKLLQKKRADTKSTKENKKIRFTKQQEVVAKQTKESCKLSPTTKYGHLNSWKKIGIAIIGR